MTIILITGPSGVGKDSLLRFAKNSFAEKRNIVFIRRYITRPPDGNEQNFFVDRKAFILLQENDFFVSHWQAHGNCYGIARSEFTDQTDHSLTIVSVSRQVVGNFEQTFDKVVTLSLTVDDTILRQRLKTRGREDQKDIDLRLARSSVPVAAKKLIIFDNSSELSISGKQFTALLQSLVNGALPI